MARDESEYHRYKKSVQTSMFIKTGTMGKGLATERLEDVMTDPEDYFIVPPRVDDDRYSQRQRRKVADGQINFAGLQHMAFIVKRDRGHTD